VNQRRIVTECISGSVTDSERPQFAKLRDRLEPGDVLIVTKLDLFAFPLNVHEASQ
jgi:putative DNA-invertase from lambdoid prophage Rac